MADFVLFLPILLNQPCAESLLKLLLTDVSRFLLSIICQLLKGGLVTNAALSRS